jgi:hypothetical protein
VIGAGAGALLGGIFGGGKGAGIGSIVESAELLDWELLRFTDIRKSH